VSKICDFWSISRCISVTVRDRAYRLLLITNMKSYTGSRLPPNSIIIIIIIIISEHLYSALSFRRNLLMTLNELERQNKGFYVFFWRFWAATQVCIIHKVTPRNWRWWHGAVGNVFRLKRSYFTPGTVSTAMGTCRQVNHLGAKPAG